MKVTLKQATPLEILVSAIRICKGGIKHEETVGNNLHPTDLTLIRNILHKKHESVLEHIIYTFEIIGISRLCLQEVVRHRIASYSVQSTRFTLKKLLKNEKESFTEVFDNVERASQYMVLQPETACVQLEQLENLRQLVIENELPNDVLKYAIPESFKTSLYMTINARSLRNFFKLRLASDAHFEIRKLAMMMQESLPKEHLILYENI